MSNVRPVDIDHYSKYTEDEHKLIKPKNSDYNFYEGDMEDIQTNNINLISDKSASSGLGAGIFALLCSLVLVGLTAVIFHRDLKGICNSVILTHLIIACLAVVAAIIGIIACINARSATNN